MAELIDTTFRSVVFNLPDRKVKMTPYVKQVEAVEEQKVDSIKFYKYYWVLMIMAQLSRMIYCDAGFIRTVLMSEDFGFDNKAINDLITKLDDTHKPDRYVGVDGVTGSRPPLSYTRAYDKAYTEERMKYAGDLDAIRRTEVAFRARESSKTNTSKFATYYSSPSDVTFMFLDKKKLKCSEFKEGDVVLIFKGSSSRANFKHDLYSQILGPEDIMSYFNIPGRTRANMGPIGFLKPLKKSFHIILKAIEDYKPKRLFITGHSLGGAYATLTAFILSQMKLANNPALSTINTFHVISFGSPTVFGDGARNTFNESLDSGLMTYDRIVTQYRGTITDIITTVPVGFSHPGFQPLRTELYPELKTGRAYHINTIKKVYRKGSLRETQKGGLLGIGKEKTLYEKLTKSHMPNRTILPLMSNVVKRLFVAGLVLPTNVGLVPHLEYMDMTYIKALRIAGRKNPGKPGNTFTADFSDGGLEWKYISASPDDTVAADANEGEGSLAEGPPLDPKKGGTRKRKIY